MPQRFVYSPKAYVYIKNIKGEIMDLKEYVVAGRVSRVVDQASSAEIRLRNPDMIFTTAPVAFHPMDPITIYLERRAGYPVQVFTGYLDRTPYTQLFPGIVTLKATCTLKKLMYTYFQLAQPYTLSFLQKMGWTITNSGAGQVIAPKQGAALGSIEQKLKEEIGANKPNTNEVPFATEPGSIVGNDGSFSQLLWGLLYFIGEWRDENIYLEAMPATVPKLINTLWRDFNEQGVDKTQEEIESYWEALVGSQSFGSGGAHKESGSTEGVRTGNIKDIGTAVRTMIEVANKFGVPPEMVLCTALCEEGFDQNSITRESGGAIGWFQFQFANVGGIHSGRKYAPYSGKGNDQEYSPADAIDTRISTEAFCKAAAYLKKKDPTFESRPEGWRLWAKTTQGSDGYENRWNRELEAAKRLYNQYKGSVKGGVEAPAEETQRAGKEKTGKGGGENDYSQYHSPFEKAKGTGPSRTDMGQDYSVAADQPIVAIADCKKVAIVSGWEHGGGKEGEPGNLHAFQVTQSGPLHGHTFYYAEGVVAHKNVGETAKAGEVVATTTGSGADGGHVEFGYCTTSGIPLGQSEFSGSNATKSGMAFNRLMLTLGHVPPSTNGNPGKGEIVPGGPEQEIGSSPGLEGEAKSAPGEGNLYSIGTAASFLSQITFPSKEELVKAELFGGQKALMNAKPLLPFVQQVCQSTLRSFQSLPNGDFFGFYPDYFGELGVRKPYWKIYDIEILDGGIELNDEELITHMFAIGNTTWPAAVEPWVNEARAGVMTIFEAFTGDILHDTAEGGTGVGGKETKNFKETDAAVKFLQRYGARPLKEEYPMVFSTLYCCLLAYQQWLLGWSRQFSTPFSFTFMPELYPGGKVAYPQHGIQMYVEAVTHAWDYVDGFTTVAQMTAPSVYQETANSRVQGQLPQNMVDALLEPQRGEVASHPTAPKQIKPVAPRRETPKELQEHNQPFGPGPGEPGGLVE